MRRFLFLLTAALILTSSLPSPAAAQKKAPPPTESDYYRIVSFPLPANVVLEVGGMDFLDKEKTKLLVATRRGDIWRVDNPYAEEPALAGKMLKKKGPDGKEVDVLPDAKNVVEYHSMVSG